MASKGLTINFDSYKLPEFYTDEDFNIADAMAYSAFDRKSIMARVIACYAGMDSTTGNSLARKDMMCIFGWCSERQMVVSANAVLKMKANAASDLKDAIKRLGIVVGTQRVTSESLTMSRYISAFINQYVAFRWAKFNKGKLNIKTAVVTNLHPVLQFSQAASIIKMDSKLWPIFLQWHKVYDRIVNGETPAGRNPPQTYSELASKNTEEDMKIADDSKYIVSSDKTSSEMTAINNVYIKTADANRQNGRGTSSAADVLKAFDDNMGSGKNNLKEPADAKDPFANNAGSAAAAAAPPSKNKNDGNP